MFKGIVTLSVSDAVRSQVAAKGDGQKQITVHFPPKTELGLSSRKRAAVKLYRIPENKKVTKDCLVAEFTQGDTHGLWHNHQTGQSREAFNTLFESTKGATPYYAVYTPMAMSAGIEALDLDVSELQ